MGFSGGHRRGGGVDAGHKTRFSNGGRPVLSVAGRNFRDGDTNGEDAVVFSISVCRVIVNRS